MALIVIAKRLREHRQPVNDYEVEVKITVSPTELRTIYTSRVTGHRYDDGWQVLLAKFLQQNFPEALR